MVTGVTHVADGTHVAGGRVVIFLLQYAVDGRVMQFSAVLETSDLLRAACREEFTMPKLCT